MSKEQVSCMPILEPKTLEDKEEEANKLANQEDSDGEIQINIEKEETIDRDHKEIFKEEDPMGIKPKKKYPHLEKARAKALANRRAKAKLKKEKSSILKAEKEKMKLDKAQARKEKQREIARNRYWDKKLEAKNNTQVNTEEIEQPSKAEVRAEFKEQKKAKTIPNGMSFEQFTDYMNRYNLNVMNRVNKAKAEAVNKAKAESDNKKKADLEERAKQRGAQRKSRLYNDRPAHYPSHLLGNNFF
tara:strand:+ start:1557 stop:2288 length:732 start_codon:yes stop_codon:yes gene_type:complete